MHVRQIGCDGAERKKKGLRPSRSDSFTIPLARPGGAENCSKQAVDAVSRMDTKVEH